MSADRRHPRSGHPRSGHPRSRRPGSLRPGRDSDDPIFCEWVDAALDAPDAAAFSEELDEDSNLGRELEDYARVVSLLRGLPEEAAPDEVLPNVRQRIRRRARLRTLAHERRSPQRMPWEALFNVVLLAVLAAAWTVGVPPADPPPRPTESTLFDLAGTPLEVASALLSTYGESEVVPGSQSLTGLTFRVSVRRDELAELRAELALYPALTMQRTVLPDAEPTHVEVRVRATIEDPVGRRLAR